MVQLTRRLKHMAPLWMLNIRRMLTSRFGVKKRCRLLQDLQQYRRLWPTTFTHLFFLSHNPNETTAPVQICWKRIFPSPPLLLQRTRTSCAPFSKPPLWQVAGITHPAIITRCKPLSWPPPLTHTGLANSCKHRLPDREEADRGFRCHFS